MTEQAVEGLDLVGYQGKWDKAQELADKNVRDLPICHRCGSPKCVSPSHLLLMLIYCLVKRFSTPCWECDRPNACASAETCYALNAKKRG